VGKFQNKWRPDFDLSDPAGWKDAGVHHNTWRTWRKRHGIRAVYLYWEDRDWLSEARALVARGRIRHVGDLALQLGVPFDTLKTWAKRYRHKQGLYELIGELPRPSWYYSGYAVHIRRATIQAFNAARQRLIADGMDELEATHKAADHAVAKFRAIARERRKKKREARYGPDPARFDNTRLTKRDCERIAAKLRAELGRLRIERFMQEEEGYSSRQIARILGKRRTPKETTTARAKRKGWSAKRLATYLEVERAAIERSVQHFYGKRERANKGKTAKVGAATTRAER
jgi:hypothetical protein